MFQGRDKYRLVAAQPVETGRRLGVADLVEVARRRILLVLAVSGLFLGLGLAYLQVSEKLYQATSTVMVDLRANNLISPGNPTPNVSTEASILESQVAVIRSPSVIRRVVTKLDLASDIEFNGRKPGRLAAAKSAARSFLQAVFTRLHLAPLARLVAEPPAPAASATTSDPLDSAAAAVGRRLNVTRVGTTQTIAITFTSNDPDKAARIANEFASAYLVDIYEVGLDNVTRASEWLGQRLLELQHQTEAAEARVEQYKADHGLVTSNGRLIGEQRLSELNGQLALAKARVAETKAKLDEAANIRENSLDAGSMSEALSSPAIADLKRQYGEVSRRLADLSSRFGDTHPSVEMAKAEQQQMKLLLQAELRKIVDSYTNDYNVALSREASLAAEVASLTTAASSESQSTLRLKELEREASSTKALYETLLGRSKELSIQGGLPTSQARILSAAVRPSDPSSPPVLLILLAAPLSGIVLGLSLAFVVEHLDTRLRTPRQVEQALGIPVVANLPRLRVTRNGPITRQVVDKPMSAYAEAIRTLRAFLMAGRKPGGSRIVTFVSALPAEGKSTTAINFARQCAQSGDRTLLIDADLRHPTLSMSLDCHGPGLSDYLLGAVAVPFFIPVDGSPDLALLPAGTLREGADTAKVLSSARLGALLDAARAEYDVIVVDGSPLIPIADGRLMLRHVDAVLLVAEWNVTNQATAEEVIRLVRDWDGTLAGILLNKVAPQNASFATRRYAKRFPQYYGTA